MKNVTNLPNYFPPIVNFYNINNTAIDYGDAIYFAGDMVSYEPPNITLSGQYLLDYAEVSATKNDLQQYESTFSRAVTSRPIGESGLDTILGVQIYDGVCTYSYSLAFSLKSLQVTIFPPPITC